MAHVRRVNARDVAQAGGLTGLIAKLLGEVRTGNMDVKERAAMFLRSLTEQAKGLGGPEENEDPVVMIAKAGGIKALVSLTVIGSPVAQKHACAALANIANGHTSHQEAIVESGGVLPIASALRGGDSGLQEQAAFAVSCLSQLEASRRSFIKVGAIPSLIKLLKDASDVTQVHVSNALAYLAENNPEGQSAIARTGALELLLDKLGSGVTQEAVAHALAKLTYGHEDNQAEVTRLNGIPKLVALLNVVNTNAQASAAAAIAAVASGDSREEKDTISKAGGIRPLLALVESRYTPTQRSAINAIAMIAQNHHDIQVEIAALGGIMPLVSITQAGSAYPADVQAQTVLALAEIARHNYENQTAIAGAGALPSLVNLLRNCNAPMVEAEIAGALWSLSEDHPANKVAIKGSGAIPGLIPLIGSQNEKAQILMANAIASLALQNEINQEEACALLVGKLEDHMADTSNRAAELLWRIVRENPDSASVIAKSGDAEALVRLLHSKQPRAKAYALWSLSLSIDASNQKIVTNAGGIRPLVHMLSALDRGVSEQAARAIKLLTHGNAETQQAVAAQGAIEPLIALLDADSFDRSQEYAAAALSYLALIQVNKVAIDRGGGIQPLVGLLSDGHQHLGSKQYAAAALARLAADEVERQQREALEKEFQELRDRMKKKSDDQQDIDVLEEVAAGMLLLQQRKLEKLLHEYEQRCQRLYTKAEKIANAGAVGPLVELLNGELGLEAQEEAAHALWALADISINRKSITDHGGIGPLVELLGCSNKKASMHAEGALVRLSIEDVNRVLIIQQLVGMLHENSGQAAQEQAAQSLANLARESTDNRKSILDAGGIPRLLDLLSSTSLKAKENAVSAVAQLALKNPDNQKEIAQHGGIPRLVSTLTEASSNSKELAQQQISMLAASAIWNVADNNLSNQTLLLKEGAVPPVVALLGNPAPEMQMNAAGALAALARNHPESQGAVARAGAIAPLCNLVREAGMPETREAAAAALWACATSNAPNQATIAKLGGIEPLVNMLMFGTSDTSLTNAAGALTALAREHSDNCAVITKRIVTAISNKGAQPARAVRLLYAVATLCDNEQQNQIAFSKMAGIQPLIPWLEAPEEEVQVQAARALLAVASNNSSTQALIGSMNAIKPLVSLIAKGSLPAQENAASALWHLATMSENRVRIAQAEGFGPLVRMLIADSDRAPQISSMTLLRLAQGSTRAANAIADAGGIKPLVMLLDSVTMATQQMAAACLAAIGAVSRYRDDIVKMGGIRPLIKLLVSKMLGTPETAARALGCLARDNGDDVEVYEAADNGEEQQLIDATPSGVGDTVKEDMSLPAPEASVTTERSSNSQEDKKGVEGHTSQEGGARRRAAIKAAGGVKALISMLDGSNLCGKENVQKPLVIGGWVALRIGIEGCLESQAIFPGGQVDFGVRIGMQEQAASTLSDLAFGDRDLQDAIIEQEGVAPLLSLVRSGSLQAQEFSARALWYLASSIENQRLLVQKSAIVDLVLLLKNGSPTAQYAMPAAAALAELAYGGIVERERKTTGGMDEEVPPADTELLEVEEADDPSKVRQTLGEEADGDDKEATKMRRKANRLLAINDAGGIVPLVKICESGTTQGKEKATAAIWHLALDRENQVALAANGAIKPLVSMLADGTPEAKKFASKALTRMAIGNSDNQAQIAKRLVGLLDHDDASVVSLAASDLQALASHPGAPIVIVNAGAILPLVSVLSNGKSDFGRNQAATTLHTLANSGPANQIAIAIGLVALLGVGTDQAQEYVTQLLLDLTSAGADADLESVKTNRLAIANAGPFRMLVMQLQSASAKVRMLGSAVLSKLSGDMEQNVTEIANANGISPLVALLGEDNADTQHNASAVLADMSRVSLGHAAKVASEGGINLLVSLLSTSTNVSTKANAADTLGSVAVEHAQQVGSSGAIVPLVALIKTQSNHAQKTAARALAAIAAGGKDNQDSIKEAGGVELLVGLLNRPSISSSNDRISPGLLWDRLRAVVAEKAVVVLEGDYELVQSMAAAALSELARGNSNNQMAITACGGIQPLIQLVTDSSEDAKVAAASTLWSLADKNFSNQQAIANANGLEALVIMAGHSNLELGQQKASGAIASLAQNNDDNTKSLAEKLVKQLATSKKESSTREKAARAVANFARADVSNQDAVAAAGGIELIVSHLEPRVHQEKMSVDVSRMLGSKQESMAADQGDGKHHLTQRELASALWALADANSLNQKSIARAGAIPLLIAMLSDHPEVRRDAAGALWKLAADAGNQRLIAEAPPGSKWRNVGSEKPTEGTEIKNDELAAALLRTLVFTVEEIGKFNVKDLKIDSFIRSGEAYFEQAGASGIPKLTELLKPAKNNNAQDTAAGALESLALLPENREQIADSDGISLLIPLFESPCSEAAKRSVEGALLTLGIDNPSNQFNIANKIVAMLASLSDPHEMKEAATSGDDVAKLRIEAQEHATRVLYSMTLQRDYRDAISRTQAIFQLVRLLRSGTEAAQQMASMALTQIARMSSELRVQVTQQLVTLLGDDDANVRQRAGTALRDNNDGEGKRSDDAKHQKEAVMSGGVAPLVELLKAGLRNDRVEAQEYALRSLTMTTDSTRRRNMVEEGVVPLLIQSLHGGKLHEESEEHAAMVLACLALDSVNHEEMVEHEGISQLVKLLSQANATTGCKRQAAIALARLCTHGGATQVRIADAGAIQALVRWLGDAGSGLLDVGALCLASLAEANEELQVRIAETEAISLIVAILVADSRVEAQKAACRAVANLANNMPSNQELIAKAGGIPPLVKLLKVVNCEEEAAAAISTVANHPDSKMQILSQGGIPPLVQLLDPRREKYLDPRYEHPKVDPMKTAATQQHSARAIESLARDCVEIQDALAAERASSYLVSLLASDAVETQESAVGALLSLAAHAESRNVVVMQLVGILMQRNTSAQLKAAEALALLASRSSVMRTAIVHAGAIEPLVQLLGSGTRSEKGTPPERAAAVLSDLARFSEGKVEMARAGGIKPLVLMLSSTCDSARTHASCALRHLSAIQENKAEILELSGIEKFVELLSDANPDTQRHACYALWQLATSVDSKVTIVEAGGIKPLVECMKDIRRDAPHTQEVIPDSAAVVTNGAALTEFHRSPPVPRPVPSPAPPLTGLIERSPETKESAVAMLAELARNQGDHRHEIVRHGGIEPMVELLCKGTPAAQKYAACAIWGISQESQHRRLIAEMRGAIAQLVDLLRQLEGETQGFAASTLVCMAQDKVGKETILGVGGAGPLMTIALGPTSWLRARCVEVLRLLGYPDPLSKKEGGVVAEAPVSPRLAKFQMKLSKNPAIWMVPDEASKALINDEHMADLACKVKQGDRVIVDPGNRKAEVRFVGKIPEIGKGYWVGVQYDDPVGRNDGSVKGRRCFECTHDFGGFLRPNHIRIDPTPPARKGQKVVAATGLDEKLGADDGKSRKPRKPRAVTKDSEMSFDWKKPDEPAKETGLATAVALVPSTEPMDTMADKGGKRTKQGQVVLATKISKPAEAKPSEIRPTDAIPAEVKESPNPVKPALASRKESSVKEKRLSVVNAPKIK